MIQICRAEDGHVSQVCISVQLLLNSPLIWYGRSMHPFGILKGDCVSRALRDVDGNISSRAGSLELFLHQQTGVDEEAIIAYLSDGRRLRNDSIRDLAGAQDQVRMIDDQDSAPFLYCASRYSCSTSTISISTYRRSYMSWGSSHRYNLQ